MTASAQKKDIAETEANAAASEAANVARAEVLEQAKKEETTKAKAAVSKLEKVSKDTTKAASKTWHDFQVEVWITPFNSIEFGFWKKERNRGKSRQFTSDMDIFAEIIENGQRTGVLGYRKELWKDASGMDKRLVFKLFSENLNWKASMDMMLGRSIQQTLAAHGLLRPLLLRQHQRRRLHCLSRTFGTQMAADAREFLVLPDGRRRAQIL